MTERVDEDDEGRARTEELMKSGPPPSVLGDVDDAVTPDVDGELTPWSPRGQDEEEGEG